MDEQPVIMDEQAVRETFEYVNQCTLYHVQDSDHMKNFLSFLGRLKADLSVTNKILVYGYNAKAVDVRTEEEWSTLKIHVIHKDQMIHTMRCTDPEKNIFEDRILYDVSATDGKLLAFQKYPDAGTFAERLLMYPPCPIVFLENAPPGKGKAEFDPGKKVIEVTRGFGNELDICHLMLREFAHFFIFSRLAGKIDEPGERTVSYDRKIYGVNAFSVAYAVSERFGVKLPDIRNIQLNSHLDVRDIMEVLKGLDDAIEKVSEQVIKGPILKRVAEEAALAEQIRKEKEEEARKEEEEKIELGVLPPPPGR